MLIPNNIPNNLYILGIDVSKDKLVVYDGTRWYEFKNEKNVPELSKLIKKKSDYSKTVLCYEPTGVYSKYLDHFSFEHKIKVLIVNPFRSSNFMKSQKTRSKNDKNDAKGLWKFAILDFEEVKDIVIEEDNEKLKRLIAYSETLKQEEIKFLNIKKAIEYYEDIKKGYGYIQKDIDKFIEDLRKARARVLKDIKAHIKSNKKMEKAEKYIKSITGVGDKIAPILLSFFMTYKNTSRTKITSLAGLDVIEKVSGKSVRGKKKISKKGNRQVRAALFLSALVAIRHDKRMRELYNKLIEKGKAKKVAIVAVMRKILIISHSLCKNEQYYEMA